MESTASLRLPVQSPPVSRGLPARQGHQHPGGIEAAQCAGAVGLGSCHYQSGWIDTNTDCDSCCFDSNRTGALSWVSNAGGAPRWCGGAPPAGYAGVGSGSTGSPIAGMA